MRVSNSIFLLAASVVPLAFALTTVFPEDETALVARCLNDEDVANSLLYSRDPASAPSRN